MQLPDSVRPLLKHSSVVIAVIVLLYSIVSNYNALSGQTARNSADIRKLQDNMDKMATKEQVEEMRKDLRDIRNWMLNQHK